VLLRDPGDGATALRGGGVMRRSGPRAALLDGLLPGPVAPPGEAPGFAGRGGGADVLGGGPAGRGFVPVEVAADDAWAVALTELFSASARFSALDVTGPGPAPPADVAIEGIGITAPHLRHFIFRLRPATFSSSIWYLALQL